MNMNNRIAVSMSVSLLVLSTLLSCQKKYVAIEEVIERFDDVDFSSLRGKAIHFRSGGHSRETGIYFVFSDSVNCAPYAVEYSRMSDSIVNIDSNLVVAHCEGCRISEGEIRSAMKRFIRYGVVFLHVDHEGNVFINPDSQDSPRYLRISLYTHPSQFSEYRLYRDHWYVRRQ